jgi:hypothetical protein
MVRLQADFNARGIDDSSFRKTVAIFPGNRCPGCGRPCFAVRRTRQVVFADDSATLARADPADTREAARNLMFGDWDGLILRIVVIVIVVLVLVGLVYWLVRRYASGGLGAIGRGRVPRLAIVDAMPVDGRRRLILLRRDNVEHLVLVGGSVDVVVEQNIQRPRARPAVKPASPPPAPPPQPYPAPEPIFAEPSPPVEIPQSSFPPPPLFAAQPSYPTSLSREAEPSPYANVPPSPQAPVPQPIERPFPPIRRPTAPRVEAPAPAPLFAAAPPPPEPESSPAVNGGDTEALPEFLRPRVVDEAASFTVPPPGSAPGFAPADDTAAKVNDLEREMARLLGEIQKH